MSEDQHQEREVFTPEVIDDYQPSVPVAPGDVASAARSCQAIILILMFLALLACAIVVVALVR